MALVAGRAPASPRTDETTTDATTTPDETSEPNDVTRLPEVLVHGRADPALRSPTTLDALAALADRGYVGRDDGANLAVAKDDRRCVVRMRHGSWLVRGGR